MARSVLLNLLGNESSAVRALRNVGSESDRAADHIDRLDDSNRRASDGAGRSEESHGRLASMLSRLAPAAGQAAASIGMVAAGVGTAVPAVAGLSAALVAVAPAAAVAATGIAAIGLAGAALKIGMSGVGDAVSAALDPSNPEAYAKALEKLSPNARAFVGEIHKLQPEFAAIKTAVQDTLFQGLDKSFSTAARTTLPIFRDGLVGAAQALNGMGKNLLSSVTALGKSGALKSLFDGAAGGLKNLTKIPGQLLTGFVQLGAAAAPVFGRMTKGIGDAVTKVAGKLSKAFDSGALSGAINVAVGLLKQLGQVAKNVFTIVGNVFGAANATGGGFINTLQTITGVLAQISGTAQFQQGLQALFGVMANLAQTAAPLLGQALQVVAQVLTALAPAANVLVTALGAALQPVIAALGPVLVAVAQAVGALVIALAPLLPVIGQLIAALLPVLVPIVQLLTTVLTALTPVIALVAQALTAYLVPVITTVVGWVTQAITWFTNLAAQVFPALVGAITSANGPFAGLRDSLANLWDAVQPLAAAIWDLAQRVFTAIAPALVPVGAAIVAVARVLVDVLGLAIDLATAAINALTDLLDGKAAEALRNFGAAVSTTTNGAVGDIKGLDTGSKSSLNSWVASAWDAVKRFGAALIQGIKSAITTTIGALRTAGATVMRVARSLLVSAGKAVISGLIDGILSMVGNLSSILDGITSLIPRKKGPPAKDAVLLRPSGILIMDGLIDGIASRVPALTKQFGEITRDLAEGWGNGIAKYFGGAAVTLPIVQIGEKIKKALLGTASEIDSAVKQIAEKIKDAFKAKEITKGDRDGLLDMLASSNKQLKQLSEERQKILDKIKEARDFAKKVMTEALSFAALTNIKVEGGGTPTGQQLVAGLQAKLAQIRQFSGNIKKLAQAGLSKSLLRQILDAGIDGGSAIAAELANGPNSIIAALNSAQVTIEKVAKGLGLNSADLLFDSGKNAGAGFLKGLESMEAAITDAMNQIVMALLEALGIGIDKYKKKLDELAHLIQQTALMKPPDIPAPPNATPNPLKAPAKPILTLNKPAAPKQYQGVGTATLNTSPIKTVSITQHVTVKDRVDADMLMNAAAFKARSASF